MATITGAIKQTSTIVDTLAVGATRPVVTTTSFAVDDTETYTNGTTANAVNRVYYFTGSAAATPTTINLSTIVCNDGTTGFTNVRELIIWNDSTTDGQTLTCFGGTTPFAPHLGGSTPTQIIAAGGSARITKPLGTTGYAVSTTINVKIDPGANTITFRIMILGN